MNVIMCSYAAGRWSHAAHCSVGLQPDTTAAPPCCSLMADSINVQCKWPGLRPVFCCTCSNGHCHCPKLNRAVDSRAVGQRDFVIYQSAWRRLSSTQLSASWQSTLIPHPPPPHYLLRAETTCHMVLGGAASNLLYRFYIMRLTIITELCKAMAMAFTNTCILSSSYVDIPTA